jgi:hypothetical protein
MPIEQNGAMLNADALARALRAAGSTAKVTVDGAMDSAGSVTRAIVALGGKFGIEHQGANLNSDAVQRILSTGFSTPAVLPPVPNGGMMSLTVLNTTPIDPLVEQTSGNTVGTNGSGWVAIVVLKGITSLVGTCVPSALTLSVTDPGFDSSGNVTIVSRTIVGVSQLRRQYPNGASMMISTDGTNLTLYITLSDWIYTPTTIVSATIGSTFYTGATAGNTGATYANLSQTAYTKPLFGWLNPQNDTVTAATAAAYPVEGVAMHRHARNGQQVACIQYSVTDGTLTTSPALVGAPTLSTRQTQGQVIETWAASLNLSTLAQSTAGNLCTANAKVYPWLGDSTAVMDLSVSGYAWPTSLPLTKLNLFNDRTGAYGGGYAYVQAGAGGTPQVSATPATARANPYATIALASTALRAWNNTNRAHNDLGGGTIRLMDNAGAAQTHTIAGALVNAGGATWWVCEADPLNTGVVTINYSGTGSLSNMSRFRNLTLATGGGSSFMIVGQGVAREMTCCENVTFDSTAAAGSAVSQLAMKYLYNVTIKGGRILNFGNIAPATDNIPICLGMVSTTANDKMQSTSDQPKLFLGCSMPGFVTTGDSHATGDGDDGRILYNNRFYRGLVLHTTVATLPFGFANVQNLYENDGLDSGNQSMNMFADGDLTTVTNYIEFHNTAVGNRCSRMYNDQPNSQLSPSGVLKMGASRYNIWDDYNIKADTYQVASGGSLGGLSYTYSVGNEGNVCLFGDVSRAATVAPHNDNSAATFLGNAWLPSSEYNLFRTALGFTQAQIMAMFTNYTVGPQASPLIGGTYTLVAGNANLKGRVPAGNAVLLKDFAGSARKNDGTGAAGCYESP